MIDPRAIIDPKAELEEGVEVGPFSIIGAEVRIGTGTKIGPHTVIKGPTQIGRDNQIYQFSSIGEDPQDRKYAGEATCLTIGDGNMIREYCTLNRGTLQGGGCTRVGNDNWIMAYAHVAHDCVVGDHVVLANGTTLAGHVSVGDNAILGGFTLVHQFCRIGIHAFCAFSSGINMDVPPYVTVSGNLASPHGINTEGLRRRNYSAKQIQMLRRAYKTLYRSGLRLEEAVLELESLMVDHQEIGVLVDFLKEGGRGIVR